MKPFLVYIRPLDTVANARIDLRAGDAGSAAELGTGGQNWQTCVAERAAISQELMSPEMDGDIKPGQVNFSIDISKVRGVANPDRLYWQGAPVVIHAIGILEGPTSLPDMQGIVSSASVDRETGLVNITAQVSVAVLQVPLLTKQFTGAGGLGGDLNKRGVLLPAGFGLVNNIQPVWFDLTRNIGMIDGYGRTTAIYWLGEGLSDFGPSAGNYANYAALAAAIDSGAVKPGQWATALSDGLVGLGAPAQGVITVHANFGGPLTAGTLMTTLLGSFTTAGAMIDAGAFAALDAQIQTLLGHAGYVHHWTAEQVQVLDLLQAIAGSCNATMLATLQGTISITRAVTSAPVGTFDISGRGQPQVLAVANISQDPPFAQIQARAERPASVLSSDQVNFADTIVPRGMFNPLEVYRSGNLVFLVDDSEWLYINDIPSAGHYPPSPATADAYWSRYRAPDLPDHVYDPMVYATPGLFDAAWEPIAGAASEVTIVASTDTGGSSVQIGDNGGTDRRDIAHRPRVPFSPEDMYAVTWDIEVISRATGMTVNLGVMCLDAAGNNLSTDAGTYAYVAAQADAATGRRTVTGYFRGSANNGAGNNTGAVSTDAGNPSVLPTGTVALRALAQINYPASATAGKTVIHEMALGKTEDVTVYPTGAWDSARTYGKLEGVTYGGRYFASKTDGNLNNLPPNTAASNAYWFLISDKGADGVSALTLIAQANVTILGNTVAKSGGTNGTFDGSAYSQESYIGAVATFQFAQTNLKCAAGITTAPGTYVNMTSGAYWMGDVDGNAYCYYNGTVIAGSATAYLATTSFQVSMDPTTGVINFIKNGAVWRTVTGGTGQAVWFDATFASNAAVIQKISFLPLVAGANAPLLQLQMSAQIFTFAADSTTPAPTSQTIQLTVNLTNLSGTPTVTVELFNAAGTSLGNATVGGSGVNRTLTVANFGTTAVRAVVTVSLTVGGITYTDVETIVKLVQGSNGVNVLLTNASMSVAASATGVVGSLTNAGGTMQLYLGTSLISTGFITFSKVSNDAALTISINSSGVYTVTGFTTAADQAVAVLRATYNGVNYDLKYTISKSKTGATGTAGTPGADGNDGSPGQQGVGTTTILTVGGVAWDGTTITDFNDANSWTTHGAYGQAIPGGASFSYQATAPFGNVTDMFVGLRSAPGASFNYDQFDIAAVRHSGTSTGIGSSTGYHTEVWVGGAVVASDKLWVDAYIYNIRYDVVSGVVVVSYTSPAGVNTVIYTGNVGSGKVAGPQVTFQRKGQIARPAFGAKGADAVGGKTSYPVMKVNNGAPATYTYPYTATLLAGASMTVSTFINVTATTNNVIVSAQLGYSINGGGYTYFAAQAATGLPSEPNDISPAQTIVNSTGAKCTVDLQLLITKSGSGTWTATGSNFGISSI